MSSVTALELTSVRESSEAAVEVVPIAREKIVKPRLWTPFAVWFSAAIVGQIATIASYVAVGVVVGIVMGAQGADAASIQARVQELVQRPLPALLLALLPFQLGMAAVVLLAAWRSKEPLKQRLGLLPQSGRILSRFKIASLAAFTTAAALTSIIASSLFLGPPPANNPISTAIVDGSWLTITLLSILLSVIPALVEETLFRGYIQRRLLQRWSPAFAIGVTSLLFAILHVDSLHHIIAVVPLAVITGLLAYRTNSIKAGMVVHALHNTVAVGTSALLVALPPTLGEEVVGLLLIGAIVVLGLIGLPAVISLLRSPQVQPAVEVQFEPLPAVESPSVLARALSAQVYVSDSRLAV